MILGIRSFPSYVSHEIIHNHLLPNRFVFALFCFLSAHHPCALKDQIRLSLFADLTRVHLVVAIINHLHEIALVLFALQVPTTLKPSRKRPQVLVRGTGILSRACGKLSGKCGMSEVSSDCGGAHRQQQRITSGDISPMRSTNDGKTYTQR